MNKVGIPRGIFYYYYKDIWTNFFDALDIPYIISPKTNKKIMKLGVKHANDEMCLSMKVYMGHLFYLKDKCDYLLVPRIDNFKCNNQTCTNFLALYDIVSNAVDKPILNYNIDLENNKNLKKGLYEIGFKLGKSKKEIKNAYKYAIKEYKDRRKAGIKKNIKNLESEKIKILIVSHPYNTYDEMIGADIIKYLESNDIKLIYSDKFNSKEVNKLSLKYSKDIYFKYNKDNIGALKYSEDKIDGVIFLSSFPCGPDSIANELVMRKINLPYLNLIVDDSSGFAGMETRLESFIDMLGERHE